MSVCEHAVWLFKSVWVIVDDDDTDGTASHGMVGFLSVGTRWTIGQDKVRALFQVTWNLHRRTAIEWLSNDESPVDVDVSVFLAEGSQP